MSNPDVAAWLQTDPHTAISAAADTATRVIPGHLGTCVAAVLEDHTTDQHPDPNIHELAYTLLRHWGRPQSWETPHTTQP